MTTTDDPLLAALREQGTAAMLALSTYAQACLTLAATYSDTQVRLKWENRAEDALAAVVDFYGESP